MQHCLSAKPISTVVPLPHRSVDEKKTSLLSGALVEGVHDGQASEPESLRAKIQQGILALQEGLLERGTEVSHSNQL